YVKIYILMVLGGTVKMSENENKDLEVNEEEVEETVEQEPTEDTVEESADSEATEETTVDEEEDEEADVESMSEALDASVEVKPGDIVEGVVLAIDDDKNVVVGLDT